MCVGYYKSLDKFSNAITGHTHFSPPGQQLHSYTGPDGSPYHIFKVSHHYLSLIECVVVQTGLSGSGVKCYLSRLQPLLLWFIEAASLIGQLLHIT